MLTVFPVEKKCLRYVTKLNLMARLQFWSSGEGGVPLHCHYFQAYLWHNRYHCRKGTLWPKSKYSTRLFAFHIVLILLAKYLFNYFLSRKLIRQIELFNLSMVTYIEEGNLWIQTPCMNLSTPLHEQDVTQGQFLVESNRFEFRGFLLLNWLLYQD